MRSALGIPASVRKGAAAFLFLSGLFALASCSAPPTKSFHLVNTGAEPRSITLQLVKGDGSAEEAYTLDKDVEPGGQAWERVASGKYLASIWNADGKLVREIESVNALLKDKRSDFNPIVIDAALDKNFALANINYIYEGGAIADMISGAVGADQTSLKIVKLYDGAKAFEVAAQYRGGTYFVDIFTPKAQKSVAAGAIVYALVPISAEIKDMPTALRAVHKAVLAKISP
jgi:hypothetical protein